MRGSQTIERDDAMPVVSRRALLRTAALGTAVVGSGAASVLLNATPAEAAASFVPKDQELHLLHRATYGPTPATLSEIRKMGIGGWLDQQLKPSRSTTRRATS